ncbi:unnamed protein product [Parnassius apollo]|uniref:(apollo) hypothetical protein n=1 Tax=Parnassius apollo TaxID=110799 RepID=A0A8S3WVS0_PARAO|nr:unnamed protein product [Parnassius apollo]
MPVTRSQKDAPSRPVPQIRTRQVKCRDPKGSLLRQRQHHQEQQLRQIVRSSGTTTTENTTTTETTVATTTTAAFEDNGQKDEAAQKETTKKTPEDIPEKGVHGSDTTLKPKGISRRAKSMKTTSSSVRRRKLEEGSTHGAEASSSCGEASTRQIRAGTM